MKQFVKNFVMTGLVATGGGPIIVAIIYGILGSQGVVESLTPFEVSKGILTASLLAFVAGGISRIYEVERLPLFPASLIHGVVLYLDYILIYLVNGWIKNQLNAILVFTAIFIAGYALIWVIIYLTVKAAAKRTTQKLQAKPEA